MVSLGHPAVGPEAGWEVAAGSHCNVLLCVNAEGNLVLGKAVLRAYLRSTMMPGGYLDLEATYVEKALQQSDSGSSFNTRCNSLL